jgi:hypothetical protein
MKQTVDDRPSTVYATRREGGGEDGGRKSEDGGGKAILRGERLRQRWFAIAYPL